LIFKLAGGAAVLIAALIYAFEKNKAELRRIKKCRAVIGFIGECKLQIGCFSLPVRDILDGYADRWEGGAAFIAEAEKTDVGEAARRHSRFLLDGAEERELFTAFASELGRGYKGAETARCDEYLEKFKKLTADLEADAASKGRVRIAVSACISVMAVLFFA